MERLLKIKKRKKKKKEKEEREEGRQAGREGGRVGRCYVGVDMEESSTQGVKWQKVKYKPHV